MRVSLLLCVTILGCTTTSTPADAGTDGGVTSSDLGVTTDATAAIDAGCALDITPEPALPAAPRHTPPWAFEPWISKDISTAEDTYAFVQGFEDRDIPVGVVVLDSPWETNYHSFVPNPSRYPAFETMVRDLRARGVRIVLWMTQRANQSSYDLEQGGDVYDGPVSGYSEARQCGFFVNRGRLEDWWKGRGASVDFENPRARAWWHARQNALLDLGINGWKLDFGDSYVRGATVETASGSIPHQQYSESYYRDFLDYGVSRRMGGTREFVTMVRPWDGSYEFAGRFYARPEHAPVAWVGDNRRDWIGLADALDSIFRSARAGYVVLGSDVGGYLDRNDLNLVEFIPFDVDNFQRWTAVMAMMPFFQLHGRANLAPWTVPERVDETVRVYREWSKLHHAMVPYWYSVTEEAYAGGPVPIQPVGAEAEWPSDFRFAVGNAFFVAPILDNTGVRNVPLPSGARYYDWWTPAAAPLAGGTTLMNYDSRTPGRIPLFVREGAIVPANVTDDVNGLGGTWSRNALTVLVWPAATESRFTLHVEDGANVAFTARAETNGSSLTIGARTGALIARLHEETAPTGVTLDGAAIASVADGAALGAATRGWFYDATTRSTYVKLDSGGALRTTR